MWYILNSWLYECAERSSKIRYLHCPAFINFDRLGYSSGVSRLVNGSSPVNHPTSYWRNMFRFGWLAFHFLVSNSDGLIRWVFLFAVRTQYLCAVMRFVHVSVVVTQGLFLELRLPFFICVVFNRHCYSTLSSMNWINGKNFSFSIPPLSWFHQNSDSSLHLALYLSNLYFNSRLMKCFPLFVSNDYFRMAQFTKSSG